MNRLLPLRCLILASFWAALAVRAAIQLDVFGGYDDRIHAHAHFPIAIEVRNDGPSFDGSFEITFGVYGSAPQRFIEALPTGTSKRMVLVSYPIALGALEIEVRLRNEKGKVVAEKSTPRQLVIQSTVPLAGALPDSFGGIPLLPVPTSDNGGDRPAVARLDAAYLPDNPIALEGLNILYVSSAKLAAIKQPQADAILGWLNQGGHLVIGFDQVSDLAGARWLLPMLPLRPEGTQTRAFGSALEKWLRDAPQPPQHAFAVGPPAPKPKPWPPGTRSNKKPGGQELVPSEARPARSWFFGDMVPDPGVATATGAVLVGTPAAGATVEARDATGPLIVRIPRGRGLVTLLTFNPEREPVRSWKLRPQFWATVMGVAPEFLRTEPPDMNYQQSMDGALGAMIVTDQVRKLPVGVLLALLAVYLIVIGPFDRWLIRKLGRPMLTWITFPAYVAAFSLLIYFIGFKLRAGRTEFNELHVVDVLPLNESGDRAALRGRAFTSLYSPQNETYPLGANIDHMTFRIEGEALMGGGGRPALSVLPKPGACEAESYVPVWTSQMPIADWADFGDAPIRATVTSRGWDLIVEVENRSGRALSSLWVAATDRMVAVQDLAPGARRSVRISEGAELRYFGMEQLTDLMRAASRQNQIFGGHSEQMIIEDWGGHAASASFTTRRDPVQGQNAFAFQGYSGFTPSAGFDLGPCVARGDVVVMAWMEGHTLLPELNRFSALRSRRGTLLRLVIPAQRPATTTP
jgi:hypothetical protein